MFSLQAACSALTAYVRFVVEDALPPESDRWFQTIRGMPYAANTAVRLLCAVRFVCIISINRANRLTNDDGSLSAVEKRNTFKCHELRPLRGWHGGAKLFSGLKTEMVATDDNCLN